MANLLTRPLQFLSRFFTTTFSLASSILLFPFRLLTFLYPRAYTKANQVPLTSSSEKCRYNLSNSTSSTIVLPDGRELGYAEYGSPTGHPIIYLHGLPGSRIEGVHFHDKALRLGARIIAVDRPGMGWSSPSPGRKLLDFTEDLKYLISHLKLESYSVLVRSSPSTPVYPSPPSTGD